MPGRHVVRLAGLDDRVSCCVGELELALEHDTPVRALATVVGEALEHVRHVGVGGVGLERHGVVGEFAKVASPTTVASARTGV